jgi:O-antigen/teichoic acid export membrane protein
MAVNSLLIVALLAGDDQRYLAVMLGTTTVVSLLLNLVLTRPLGVWGLVATLALTEIFICVLAAVRYRRVSAIRFNSTVPEGAS